MHIWSPWLVLLAWCACHVTAKTDEVLDPPSLQCICSVPSQPTPMNEEVASAWGSRVGPPSLPAPADRVQSLFNDLELYPTKTQVFEMLVCARQCARRKSLTLTFGEFCVYAAELRRCARRARHASGKTESPPRGAEATRRDPMPASPVTPVTPTTPTNGREAAPAPCEVFLGGSCNPTTWRSDIAIPLLEKMGITYFNPQVEDWSTELVEVEHRAKAAARALLFVLDSETRAVAASVEAAHLAASPRDLLLVLRPYRRHQRIGAEPISDQEYVELSRARATLQEAVERRGLPAFTDIPAALRCARAVVRGARTHPRQPLGHTILRLKRAFDASGGRAARLPRPRALQALRDVTLATSDAADRCLPATDSVDFETFCAAVAELASEQGDQSLTNGGRVTVQGGNRCADAGAGVGSINGFHSNNSRLKACGKKLSVLITRSAGVGESGSAASTGSGSGVFTPGTERRLEQLPAMLGAPAVDVYLGGSFPSNSSRPEEVIRKEGYTCVVPRVNDYTRMFSAPARRAAPAHPESPRTDKKPRPSLDGADVEEVELRSRSMAAEPSERLSASDFYSVSEDITPQPFKGTYDEDLLLGSRVLLFAMSAESPCFAPMVLAAHYMGLRPTDMVLLVQPMDPAQAHTLSEVAVKDYNRGRHYLSDLAQRSGVPVFQRSEDALACVLAKLRSSRIGDET